MYQVVKRDGKVVDFNISKISAAIIKAFNAREKEFTDDTIDFLALKVTADYNPKIQNGKVGVEEIQDSVESVLQRGGYEDVAKAYILYRKQREKARYMKSALLDYKELVDSYVKVSDWRVKENSTVTYSVGGLILNNSGAITANYWLTEIYDDEIAPGAPEHGHPSARSFHAHRLLRRMVPEAAHPGRPRRHLRKDHFRPGQAPRHPLQPDGELPRHHAERMGRSPGLLLL